MVTDWLSCLPISAMVGDGEDIRAISDFSTLDCTARYPLVIRWESRYGRETFTILSVAEVREYSPAPCSENSTSTLIDGHFLNE